MPRFNRIDFLFLVSWLIVSLGVAFLSVVVFGVDFRGYYAAAKVLLAGGNPYDYRLVADALLEITGEMGNNPFYYPLWFAWLFIPLVWLPFQTARWIWMAFNLVLWSVGLWRLGELVHWPPEGWKRYFFFLLATLSFAWIVWRYEQAGILVFFLLLAALLAAQKEKWDAAGIWLALSLIKPNITLPIVAGISLWLLSKGWRRPVAVMIATLLALLAISTLITPDWFAPFFEPGFGLGLTVALDGPDTIVMDRINTTFMDWLSTLNIQGLAGPILYGFLICAAAAAFYFTVARSRSLLEAASLCTVISFAVTPYALQYDYPPLVIPLFWALSLPNPSSASAKWKILMAAFVFSVNIWQQNISYGYWIVVGMTILVAYALGQARKISAPAAG
jgi:hypothetical protein